MILQNKTIAEKFINIFKVATEELLSKYNADTINYKMVLNGYTSIYREKIPYIEIDNKRVSMWVYPANYYDEYSRLTSESSDFVEGSYTKSVSLFLKINDSADSKHDEYDFMHVKFIHVKSMSTDGLGEKHKVFIELPDFGSGFIIDETYDNLSKEVATLINTCCEHWVKLFEDIIG
jgi:hypothetical protein